MARTFVTAELRRAVFQRDGRCVIAISDASHSCYDAWGDPHASDDLDRMTVEHVKSNLAMGRRAPSDLEHLVTMCGWINVVMHPTKLQRQWMRQYLMRFVPKEDAA